MNGRALRPPTTRAPAIRARPAPRGVILILVLVVIAVLSLSALTFSELMLVEHEAANLSGRQAQAQALAESGVEMTRLFLSRDEVSQFEAGGCYDNWESFQNVLVIDDEEARHRGRFTVVAPLIEDGYCTGVRYGLEDDSIRFNLNALTLLEQRAEQMGLENGGREVLMVLPGMTEDMADAILDWIDSDDEPREYGAEVDYYSSLDPPYAPRNGPLETVEELLLVRDVSPYLLFGSDANRNGQADLSEPDAAEVTGIDNSDGSMTRGWAAYLTLYSLESNLGPEGEPKIYVNQDDLETLYDELAEVLDAQWATFIVALRRYGPSDSEQVGESEYTVDDLDLSLSGDHKLTTILDLIGTRVEVTEEQASQSGGGDSGDQAGGQSGGRSSGQEGGREQEDETKILESPFGESPAEMLTYLTTLMDYLTVVESEQIPARINVNQAPATILAGIPGMTSELVDEIIARRQPDPSLAEDYQRHATWLLCDGAVTLDQMKQLMPFVTAGGSVYRAQVVGFFEEEGPSARIEVVLDASSSPARVVFYRDLTHLGQGYAPETLGIQTPEWQ
jgi:hypothetical protein